MKPLKRATTIANRSPDATSGPSYTVAITASPRSARADRTGGPASDAFRGPQPEQVPHLLLLRQQVALVLGAHRRLDLLHVHDLQPERLEPHALRGVVGHEPHAPHAEVYQDLRADAVVAGVGREAQVDVGLDGVHAPVLQLVGADLVDQTDAAPLLPHVQDDAPPLACDARHGRVQLLAAIAAARAEHVARQALRVYAHQRRLAVRHVAHHEREVVLVVDRRLVDVEHELAVFRGNRRLGALRDELLGAAPVLDQVGDGEHPDAVALREGAQLGQPGHGPIGVHDLANDGCRIEPGELAEVYRGLGLTRAPEHAALGVAEREHVAGAR